MNIIYKGKWVYNWFSNMEPSEITIDGTTYPSVENYYQAMKSLDVEIHKLFSAITPSKSKFLGKGLKIRPDWEEVKENFMYKALWVKFNQPQWKEKLLATNEEEIVEWNNWGDLIWGKDIRSLKGQNKLGILLMKIREQLK